MVIFLFLFFQTLFAGVTITAWDGNQCSIVDTSLFSVWTKVWHEFDVCQSSSFWMTATGKTEWFMWTVAGDEATVDYDCTDDTCTTCNEQFIVDVTSNCVDMSSVISGLFVTGEIVGDPLNNVVDGELALGYTETFNDCDNQQGYSRWFIYDYASKTCVPDDPNSLAMYCSGTNDRYKAYTFYDTLVCFPTADCVDTDCTLNYADEPGQANRGGECDAQDSFGYPIVAALIGGETNEGFITVDCNAAVTPFPMWCPNECNNQGTCVAGACDCDSGWTGDDCSVVYVETTCGGLNNANGACGAFGYCAFIDICICMPGYRPTTDYTDCEAIPDGEFAPGVTYGVYATDECTVTGTWESVEFWARQGTCNPEITDFGSGSPFELVWHYDKMDGGAKFVIAKCDGCTVVLDELDSCEFVLVDAAPCVSSWDVFGVSANEKFIKLLDTAIDLSPPAGNSFKMGTILLKNFGADCSLTTDDDIVYWQHSSASYMNNCRNTNFNQESYRFYCDAVDEVKFDTYDERNCREDDFVNTVVETTECSTDGMFSTGRGGIELNCPEGEYYFCDGVAPYELDVCSGKCVSEDKCNCQASYSGDWCEITSCAGFDSRDPTACSIVGICWAHDFCLCPDLWVHENGRCVPDTGQDGRGVIIETFEDSECKESTGDWTWRRLEHCVGGEIYFVYDKQYYVADFGGGCNSGGFGGARPLFLDGEVGKCASRTRAKGMRFGNALDRAKNVGGGLVSRVSYTATWQEVLEEETTERGCLKDRVGDSISVWKLNTCYEVNGWGANDYNMWTCDSDSGNATQHSYQNPGGDLATCLDVDENWEVEFLGDTCILDVDDEDITFYDCQNIAQCYGKESMDPEACSGNGNCVMDNKCVCHTGWEGAKCDTEMKKFNAEAAKTAGTVIGIVAGAIILVICVIVCVVVGLLLLAKLGRMKDGDDIEEEFEEEEKE